MGEAGRIEVEEDRGQVLNPPIPMSHPRAACPCWPARLRSFLLISLTALSTLPTTSEASRRTVGGIGREEDGFDMRADQTTPLLGDFKGGYFVMGSGGQIWLFRKLSLHNTEQKSGTSNTERPSGRALQPPAPHSGDVGLVRE